VTDQMAKGRKPLSLRIAMTPIMVLALGTALVAWTAAWIFRDNFVFSTTLLGIGCLPIVIAVVGYLLVLLKNLDAR
jgi:uncharacterized integral membrane protein